MRKIYYLIIFLIFNVSLAVGAVSYTSLTSYFGGLKSYLDPNTMITKTTYMDNPEAVDLNDGLAKISIVLTNTNSGYAYYVPIVPSNFKFFIPPGIKKVIVTAFVYDQINSGIVFRYGEPPLINYYSDDFDWQDKRTLDEMVGKDTFAKRMNGTINAISDFDVRVESGQWLYGNFVTEGKNTIQTIAVRLYVNVDEYKNWYNSVTWDSKGDPVVNASCSSSYPTACKTQIDCEDNNGYWWDNSCHYTPEPCSSTNISACTSEEICTDANLYWYDNKCNINVPCSANDANDNGIITTCDTNEKCSISGYYWYDNPNDNENNDVCNIDKPCDENNLALCENNQELCQLSDLYWYDDNCNTQPGCSVANLSACDTSDKCTSIDKYWYNNKCNLYPYSDCSESNYSGCSTYEECDNILGKWCDNKCYAPGTAPSSCSTSSTPSTGTGSSGSSSSSGDCSLLDRLSGTCSGSSGSTGSNTGSGTDSGNTNQDYSTATDKLACYALNGTWCGIDNQNGVCKAPNETCEELCSVDNPSACDENSCETQIGYYWDTDSSSCIAYKEVNSGTIYQRKLKAEENNSELYISLGSDLDDLTIDDGDKLDWTVNFGPYKDVYVYMGLTDMNQYILLDNKNEYQLFNGLSIPKFKSITMNKYKGDIISDLTLCDAVGHSDLGFFYMIINKDNDTSNLTDLIGKSEVGAIYLTNNCSMSKDECLNDSDYYWNETLEKCVPSKKILAGSTLDLNQNEIENRYLNLGDDLKDLKIDSGDDLAFSLGDLSGFNDKVDLYIGLQDNGVLKFIDDHGNITEEQLSYESDITGAYNLTKPYNVPNFCTKLSSNKGSTVQLKYFLTPSGITPFNCNGNCEEGIYTLTNNCE